MIIGILGAGQLARMLTLAAYPLGITTVCLDPKSGTSASEVAPVITSEYTDKTTLQSFAEQVDIITFETENIPVEVIDFLGQYCPVFPSSNALAVAQDRLQEKTLFQKLNIPTTRFFPISSLEDLEKGVGILGFPCVLKTRFFGYDGKGQCILYTAQDVALAWEDLGSELLLLEEFVSFEKEFSLITVCGKKQKEKDLGFYNLTENTHSKGILYISTAPCYDVNNNLQNLAEGYAKKIIDYLSYIGVLAIEFFYSNGQLIANEMAPRVHNSGHWTIEGASTSQFENHVRAIAGLPLGSTQALGYSAMFNCISTEPDIREILSIPNTHYHCYKKSPIKGRKLAHFTLSTPNLIEYKKYFDEIIKMRGIVS